MHNSFPDLTQKRLFSLKTDRLRPNNVKQPGAFREHLVRFKDTAKRGSSAA